MNNVCIFAGTTEGRRLIDFLETQPIRITACVATEYGEELLPSSPLLTVSMGRLGQDDMETMFRSEHFDCVIDATHPYADEATENIMNACKMSGAEYLRLLRPV